MSPPSDIHFDLHGAIGSLVVRTCLPTPMCIRSRSLIASGKIDVKPLISPTSPFEKSIEAFEFAAQVRTDVIKTQIVSDETGF